jgi:hypothetical protein
MKDRDVGEIEDDEDDIPITPDERELTLRISTELMAVSQCALSVTISAHAKQEFGNMTLEGNALVMEGIAGPSPMNTGVNQIFGDTLAKDSARGFRGQMDSKSFEIFWGSSQADKNSY